MYVGKYIKSYIVIVLSGTARPAPVYNICIWIIVIYNYNNNNNNNNDYIFICILCIRDGNGGVY